VFLVAVRHTSAVPGTSTDPVLVVGIGADGWAGLSQASRDALSTLAVLVGGPRQLELVAGHVAAELVRWPTPLLPALPGMLEAHSGGPLGVLASGDPMFFGIGTVLVKLLGADRVRVVPHPSSVSLACARLGWASNDVEVVSILGRSAALLQPAIHQGRHVLVLVAGADGASTVAELLCRRGFGPSELTVLTQLGGSAEQVVRASAATWNGRPHDSLAVVAVDCRATPDARSLSTSPGLPDDAFEHDGQLTKREVRAITLATLAPEPGELLWDVGAGSGSIGIEWMRAHPASRAIAIEPRADRRARIDRNAEQLGVPGLQVVAGAAPDALAGLPTPDAVFIGGGASADGVIDAAIEALRPGGRLVANGVTLETEAVLATWYATLGGELSRLAVQHAAPIGAFTGWRAAMPVTQWRYRRPNR
jgi:precorrin-6Y C5,15-methyltransferase (decarboxylating)